MFTPPPRKVGKVVAPRRSRLSVALLAAFAAAAAPALVGQEAWAQSTDTLYVSGGGGGGAGGTVDYGLGGSGGDVHAGKGGRGLLWDQHGGGAGGGGGGGYIGDGSGSANNGVDSYTNTGSGGGSGFGGGENGGNGAGYSGPGGNGGKASYALSADKVFDEVFVLGGDGGQASSAAAGGAGGQASISGIDYQLTANSLTVQSGTDGQGTSAKSGGAGGRASVNVGTLKAGTINVIQHSGDAALMADTLDVTGGDTTLNLTGTTAMNVAIAEAALGVNRTLKVAGSGAAVIGTLKGAGSLVKEGDGELALRGDSNTYTGKTQVNGGSLTLYSAGATGSGTVTLADNTTLNLDFNSGVYGNKIIGTGKVVINATGTQIIILSNGDNSYTGGTYVTDSVLELADVNAAGKGTVTLDNSILHFTSGGEFMNSIIDTGSGGSSGVSVHLGAGGTLILSGNNSHNSITEVNSGTLELAHTNAAGTGVVDVTRGATLRLAKSGAYDNVLISSGGTLEVVKNGVTVPSISGFENYTFTADALRAGGSAALKLTNQAGTLNIDTNNVKLDTSSGALSLALNEAATLIDAGAATLDAAKSEVTEFLDGVSAAVGGLKEKVYTLATEGTNKLNVTFSELYRYGEPKNGTPGSGGQRAQDNTLTVSSGDVATAAFGGRATSGAVSGNIATMSGGTLVKAAGNSLSGNLYGGDADEGSATGNTAQMTGGGVTNAYGGYAESNSTGGKATASGNTLRISDSGTVTGNAYGGRVYSHEGTATASTNTVEISGTATLAGQYVYGGHVTGYGSFSGEAKGNTVVLDGGSFTHSAPKIYGGFTSDGNANNNTIVLGAHLDATALQNATLYGGYSNSGGEAVRGNTLAVQAIGTHVGSINNFENLYFILPDTINSGDVMLTVDGGKTRFAATQTNIGIAMAGNAKPLATGDTVTLLHNGAGLENASGNALQSSDYKFADLTGKTIPGVQGFSLTYNFKLDNDDQNIWAEVTGERQQPKPPTPPKPQPSPDPDPKPTPVPPQPVPPQPEPEPQPQPGPSINPQTKAVVEGNIAALGALNLGADQLARAIGNLPLGGGSAGGSGAPNFGGSAGANGAGGMQPSGDAAAFAQLSVHDQKIESGSHVNVNGAAVLVGAAKMLPLAGGGTAAVGAFFEYGDGTFKTHNDFETGTVRGKGDSSYYGAGVLAKAMLAGSGNGAPFVEAALHAGSIRNNWHSDDLRDAATGQRAQYNIRTPYLGAHAGAGYRWQTGEGSHVEAYGQYLYTHMDGKDTNVALDPYHFGAVKSSRTRLGAKGAWAVSPNSQAYAGAAWEHEFDGTARATAYSLEVPAPTMKGDTAVIDAGLTFAPRQNLTTNVGVTGYAGKRKGAAANVEVQYRF